jgi:hypothetical protein
MSALGQKRTLDRRLLMSALPPKADIRRHEYDVRFVPEADIGSLFDHLVGALLEMHKCDHTDRYLKRCQCPLRVISGHFAERDWLSAGDACKLTYKATRACR